jgi:acyl carrier protein
MNTEEIIRNFIIDTLLIASDRTTIESDEELTASGVIDSLGMLRLIGFLEQEFGIQVGDGEVGEENFGSVTRIATFVDRKRSEVQA